MVPLYCPRAIKQNVIALGYKITFYDRSRAVDLQINLILINT